MASRKYLIYVIDFRSVILSRCYRCLLHQWYMEFTPGGFLTTDMAPRWAILQAIFCINDFGRFCKAAVMPLHGWLPAAMIAPTPVSALLHAVAVVKTGVFAVLRIIGFRLWPEAVS